MQLKLDHKFRRQRASSMQAQELFDSEWYTKTYADVKSAGVEPWAHYLKIGWAEGRNPSPLFDTEWYLRTYPDIEIEGMNPLMHFAMLGWQERRLPHPLFDTGFYLDSNPDVREANLNPLLHYKQIGWQEGRSPHPLFDPAWYVDKASLADPINPLAHYNSIGARKLIPPSPLFDPIWYVKRNPNSANNPLAHYVEHGFKQRLSPHPLFDTNYYLSSYPDVAAAGIDPLTHYLTRGSKEHRNPNARFDAEWYVRMHPEARGQLPLLHYIRNGQKLPTEPGVRRDAPAIRRIAGTRRQIPGQKSILLVAHSVPRDGRLFGAERSFLDMADSLSRLGCNLNILLPNHHPDYVARLTPSCSQIFVANYPWWRTDKPIDPQSIEQVRAIIREANVQLVYANTIMLREPLLAARAERATTAVHCRELISGDEYLTAMIGLEADEVVAEVNRMADIVVANSKAVASAFFKDNSGVLAPNIVDPLSFHAATTRPGDKIRVGIISSNIPKKGIGDFIEIAELCADESRLDFHVIGPETSLVSELKSKLSAGEIRANISFDGYIPSPQEALENLDVLMCLSSFAESFGRTVAEAMAAERLVVAYGIGAIPELVRPNETGVLVSAGDKNAAAQALLNYAADPGRSDRLRKQARDYIAENHSPKALDKALSLVLKKAGIKYLSGDETVERTPSVAPSGSKPTKLRIAYFVWHFPVPSETFVLNELRVLYQEGHDLRVYCKQIPYPDFQPDFPIKFERVKSPEDLASKLTTFGADIVHSHFVYPTVTDMVWPASEIARVPFTFFAHAQDIFRYENEAKNRIDEIAKSEWCRRVFAPSRFHRRYLIERGVPQEKVSIVPNSVDPQLFTHDRPAHRPGKSICTVARFVEKKGLETLIRAAPNLKKHGIEIYIYGYGELEERYKELVSTLCADNVYIRGPLSNRDALISAFDRHDLFICPSVRAEDGDMDGVPTVLMDAIASQIPVMATDTAGIPDLVIDGVTGLICEPTPEGICSAVKGYFDLSPGFVESMKRAAIKHLVANHDTRRIVGNMIRIWTNRKLGIVLVTWNNLPELKEVVRRLLHYTSLPFEISICDNNSSSEVKDYLRSVEQSDSRVRIFFNPDNSMVGPGTNIAMARTDADYVVYVCGKEGFAFDFNWEHGFINALDANPNAAMAGTLCYSPAYLTGKDFPAGNPMFEKFRNRQFAEQNPDREFQHVQGGLFAMRSKAVRDAEGFSSEVPHNGTDVEFSYYMESLGWELASAENMVSLYNKTRPPLEARIDESTRIAHPPTLEQLAWIDAVIDRRLHLCPLCGWKGEQFIGGLGEEICPHCGCDGDSRTIWRHLATKTTFTHRRLPALGVGLSGEMMKIWTEQFQGPALSIADFSEALSRKGQLSNQPGRLQFALLNRPSGLDHAMLRKALDECHRLLAPSKGTLLIVDEAVNRKLLEQAGFRFKEAHSYSSFACRFGWRQVFEFFN
jgi:glycosyltransferase involved in cell wall biosynthesis